MPSVCAKPLDDLERASEPPSTSTISAVWESRVGSHRHRDDRDVGARRGRCQPVRSCLVGRRCARRASTRSGGISTAWPSTLTMRVSTRVPTVMSVPATSCPSDRTVMRFTYSAVAKEDDLAEGEVVLFGQLGRVHEGDAVVAGRR